MEEVCLFVLFVGRIQRVPIGGLDTVRCAIDAGHIGRVTRIGHTAGRLELLGLAPRGVKVHGLMILGGGVSIYELDSDGPVVRRLGRPEIHVLNSLARTDIWPLGKIDALVKLIGSLACNVIEHGRLAGSKQRVACLKIALGSMHVKGAKRPVLCIVVGDLDVQVKAVLQLSVAAIERTVSHRLIGNACHLDRLRLIGLGLLGLLLHRCAPARATRRITAAAGKCTRQHSRKRHGGNS